jgi:long-chain acyl-CoA synthetase
VRDCAVFDHPDEFHGAVPHALVVLREEAAGTSLAEVLAGITEFANGQLAGFQRIRYIDAAPVLPRSPNGKIQRRELRRQLLGV